MPFYNGRERDKSYASEAANARIAFSTRLHCDSERDDYLSEEEYYAGGGGLTERDMARGNVNESQSKLFNERLRAGHEHLRR